MEGFRFTIPYSVRVADVNYGGHVANSAVLNFFQDARIAYLEHLGPFGELDIGDGCGLILPEANVRYLGEMFLGDALRIGARVIEVRRSAFVMEYRVERDGEATATGTTPLISFDYATRRPRRLPESLREVIVGFEGLRA